VITGIVLAGGTSRRFGSDKLAADLDGATLLARTIAAVEAVADGVIVVGPVLPSGFRAGEIPVMRISDPVPSGGPLVALAHALGQAVEPHPVEGLAIVVGGDMPRVVPAVLASMLDRLASDPEVDAIVLEAPDARRRQVLPLALRVAPARTVASSLLAPEDRSLKALVARLAVGELPAEAWRSLDPVGDTLADVDTREDLERLRARSGGPESPGGVPGTGP
jgi:molybdopterin-guanine dinucleotide biosynthesis protein A